MPRNSQAHAGGIACPVCREQDTEVKDSRPAFNGLAIRRRRTCKFCRHRFTTHETTKRDVPVLVFPNGVVVELDMANLNASLTAGITKTVSKALDEGLWALMREAAVKPR